MLDWSLADEPVPEDEVGNVDGRLPHMWAVKSTEPPKARILARLICERKTSKPVLQY